MILTKFRRIVPSEVFVAYDTMLNFDVVYIAAIFFVDDAFPMSVIFRHGRPFC